MIAVLRPQPNVRSVGQPEPAALGLLMGDLQPLTLPDTLDPALSLIIQPCLAQERGNLAIAIAAVLPASSIMSAVRRCSSSRPRLTPAKNLRLIAEPPIPLTSR
jgi:hypothetical protein